MDAELDVDAVVTEEERHEVAAEGAARGVGVAALGDETKCGGGGVCRGGRGRCGRRR